MSHGLKCTESRHFYIFEGPARQKDWQEKVGNVLHYPASIAFGKKVIIKAPNEFIIKIAQLAQRILAGLAVIIIFEMVIIGRLLLEKSKSHRLAYEVFMNAQNPSVKELPKTEKKHPFKQTAEQNQKPSVKQTPVSEQNLLSPGKPVTSQPPVEKKILHPSPARKAPDSVKKAMAAKVEIPLARANLKHVATHPEIQKNIEEKAGGFPTVRLKRTQVTEKPVVEETHSFAFPQEKAKYRKPRSNVVVKATDKENAAHSEVQAQTNELSNSSIDQLIMSKEFDDHMQSILAKHSFITKEEEPATEDSEDMEAWADDEMDINISRDEHQTEDKSLENTTTTPLTSLSEKNDKVKPSTVQVSKSTYSQDKMILGEKEKQAILNRYKLFNDEE